MATVEVKVPDIGDFKDVEVIEVLVKAGDTIAVDQSLVTVESDKASMEIPSSAAGVVKAMRVKLGDKVNQGTVLLEVEAQAGDAVAPAAAPAEATQAAAGEAAAPAGEFNWKAYEGTELAAPPTPPAPEPKPAAPATNAGGKP